MAQWIQSAVERARSFLEQTGVGPVGIVFAFLLGLFSAIASACCTLPMFGAIVGYSGTRKDSNRKTKELTSPRVISFIYLLYKPNISASEGASASTNRQRALAVFPALTSRPNRDK